jgi:hypothetical protein
MKVKKLSNAVRTIKLLLDLEGDAVDEDVDEKKYEVVFVRYRLGALNTNFGAWLEQHGGDRDSLVNALVRILVSWDLEVDEPLYYTPPPKVVEFDGATQKMSAKLDLVEVPQEPVLVAKAGEMLPVTKEAIEAAEVPTAFLRLVLSKVFEDAVPGKISAPPSDVS